MTSAERSWQLANALCAHALSGGTVQMATMTAILSEALQAAEAEAYDRLLAFHNEQTNQAVALAATDARQQEREACAKLADGLAFFEEGDGGEIESAWAYRNLAAKIRDRRTP